MVCESRALIPVLVAITECHELFKFGRRLIQISVLEAEKQITYHQLPAYTEESQFSFPYRHKKHGAVNIGDRAERTFIMKPFELTCQSMSGLVSMS